MIATDHSDPRVNNLRDQVANLLELIAFQHRNGRYTEPAAADTARDLQQQALKVRAAATALEPPAAAS